MAGYNDRSTNLSHFYALLVDHGSEFTENIENCISFIKEIVANDTSTIDSRFFAKLIIACLTCSEEEFIVPRTDETQLWGVPDKDGLLGQLNPAVFVHAIKTFIHDIKWDEVLSTFTEIPAFYVRSRAAVHFLMQIILNANGGRFLPIDCLYRPWSSNEIGQLTWLFQLLGSPELFCFADFPHTAVNTSALKIPPDESSVGIRNWTCLNLMVLLMHRANTSFDIVSDILSKKPDPKVEDRAFIPASQCPDLLLLSILQVNPSLSANQKNIVRQLIVQLMVQHTNAVSVLNAYWNADAFGGQSKSTVIDGLTQYYSSGPVETQQSRLTKILEVAHELKSNGLGELFNVPQFSFAIDLACLASRRDFLKLDKFLDDKLVEHGEVFAHHMVSYIKSRYQPGPGEGPAFPPETFHTMYNALQLRSAYSPAIDAEFTRLVSHINTLTKSPNLRPVNLYHASHSLTTPNAIGYMHNRGDLISGGGPVGVTSSMTTPVFGNSGRLTATTPSYSPYMSNQMVQEIRNPLPDALYRQGGGTAAGIPSQNWGNAGAGWSSRSTPIPGAGLELRPVFSQQSMAGTSHGINGSTLLGQTMEQSFPEDIQDEANTYFQQMFADQNALSVNDFIQQMLMFRSSNDGKHKDILNCVIKNLFDEFKFFNEYPDYELQTTAKVYGGFINEGIVENIQFATAVRKVIEALQCSPASPLFTFGIVALQACKGILHRYPKVCHMIRSGPNYARFPQILQDYVMAGCISQLPPYDTETDLHGIRSARIAVPSAAVRNEFPTSSLPAHTAATIAEAAQGAVMRNTEQRAPSMMVVSNMDILEKGAEKDGKIIHLDETKLIEDVSFLCNNLSQANINDKVGDIRKILDDNDDVFKKWLAQYFVMKRVTLEQNFHNLYNNFLITINDKNLDEMVRDETLRNIKILLKSDKKHAASNFEHRMLLKNLGHWLGLISIGRNSPLFYDELNLKNLLLEAFYKGQQELLYVIPFVVKVVMASTKSFVFTPQSAYVNDILRILAEIHRQSDLKLNLKFEIEVLCKELHVMLDSLIPPNEASALDAGIGRVSQMKQQLSDVAALSRPDMPGGDALQVAGGLYDPTGGRSSVNQASYNPQTGVSDAEIVQNSMASSYQQPAPAANQTAANNISAQFYYIDLSIHEPIEQQLNIPPHYLVRQYPHLGAQIRQAIGQAVREMINGIVDRSIICAAALTQDVVMKDFAASCPTNDVRRAFLQMMRGMTAAIAMITTREPIAQSIFSYLRNVITQVITQSNLGQAFDPAQELEEIIQSIMEANNELAASYVVKSSCEKATIEIEKRFTEYFGKRDVSVIIPPQVQSIVDALPADLKPQRSAPTKDEMKVYDLFSSEICSFKSCTIEDMFFEYVQPRDTSAELHVADHENLASQLNLFVNQVINRVLQQYAAQNAKAAEIVADITECRNLITEYVATPNNEGIVRIIDTFTERFLTHCSTSPADRAYMGSYIKELHSIYVNTMRLLLTNVTKIEVIRLITRVAFSFMQESRFNHDAFEFLVRNRMVNIVVYDQLLATFLNNGTNGIIVFIQKLVHLLSMNNMGSISYILPLTYNYFKVLIMQKANTNFDYDNFNITAEDIVNYRDPNDFQSKVESFFRDWMNIQAVDYTRTLNFCNTVMHIIQSHGITLTEEVIMKFFKACLMMCIDVSYRLLNSASGHAAKQRCYHTLDAYARLAVVISRQGEMITNCTRISVLQKILEIIAHVCIQDHDVNRKDDFEGLPYHRILLTIFMEIIQHDFLQLHKLQIIEVWGQTMFFLQPRYAPGFAFHWLDILGHRAFINQLLAPHDSAALTRAVFTQLLIVHIKFMSPYLRNVEMANFMDELYRGTLRVMLVVLHDFPEILCDYNFVLCDVIPSNCIQLRNLVLSAYPRTMRLPDPFGLSFDEIQTLPEMELLPEFPFETNNIVADELRANLEDYLRTRSCVTFLSDLANKLENGTQPGNKFNIPAMNAVVTYVGIRAIHQLKETNQTISISSIAHSSFMDIFQSLAVSFDSEGRYLLFNALANQLRYPNALTHYFACTLLYIFSEANCESIKEQITRILFERLVSLRPHPWGLLITFIELIRNEQYQFWTLPFVHCAVEIQRLLVSVAASCNVHVPQGVAENASGTS